MNTILEEAEQYEFTNGKYGFIAGAKWQQDKNKFSEEDMIAFGKFMFYYGSNEYKEYKDIFNEWFEQNKTNKI
jgi:hypothetical protein